MNGSTMSRGQRRLVLATGFHEIVAKMREFPCAVVRSDFKASRQASVCTPEQDYLAYSVMCSLIFPDFPFFKAPPAK